MHDRANSSKLHIDTSSRMNEGLTTRQDIVVVKSIAVRSFRIVSNTENEPLVRLF